MAGIGVGVFVGVGVGVTVGVGVDVGIRVGVGVKVGKGVTVGVAVGVGIKGIAPDIPCACTRDIMNKEKKNMITEISICPLDSISYYIKRNFQKISL